MSYLVVRGIVAAAFALGAVVAIFGYRSRYRARARLRADSQTASRLPAEQVLTLMFVDIAGFSQTVELQSPRETFGQLRALLHGIADTVRAFGGVVDRTLGDGMLCVFGGGDGASPGGLSPAEAAVACAVEIQSAHLENALRMLKTEGKPISPLRVGINTALVYVGDLGDTHRHDLTVIGNGVNLAQRMESSCESYRILLGSATFSLLRATDRLGVAVRKQLVPVKHHREPVEAYEVDPFVLREADVARVLSAHWESLGTERLEERWHLPPGTILRVETQYGPGEIVNFSLNGLGLRLHQYLGRQLPLSISLGLEVPHLREGLDQAGLGDLTGEVRWARPAERGFIHGILIKNLSAQQRHELFARLMRWLQVSDQAA